MLGLWLKVSIRVSGVLAKICLGIRVRIRARVSVRV